MKMLTVRRLLLFTVFLGFAYLLLSGFNRLRSEFSKNFVSFPKKTDTYANIFSEKDSIFLKRDLTFFSKGTNPVARFEDARDSTKVAVFKFDFKSAAIVLSRDIEPSNEEHELKPGYVYNNTRILRDFDIYRSTKSIEFSKMNFSLKGAQISNPIENDSLVCYRGVVESFSVWDQQENEVVLEIKNNSGKFFYSQFLFFKRANSVYILFKQEEHASNDNTSLYKLFTS